MKTTLVKKKKPVLLKKVATKIVIEVEKLEIVDRSFKVTVFNRGNLSSNNTKINVYLQPLSIDGAPSHLFLVASKTISLGILERKVLLIPQSSGGISSFNSHFAIAYDPLHDGFPINDKDNYTWSESNIVNHGLRIVSTDLWDQYSFSNALFQSGTHVTTKTWKIVNTGTFIDDNIKSYFAPKNTPTAFSEFRQVIPIHALHNADILQLEISKGNIDIFTSCFINTARQTPRDAGNLWLGILKNESTILEIKPSLQAPNIWTNSINEIKGLASFDQIQIRLIAIRNYGSNNDAYFSKVNVQLKHRQIAKYAGFDFLGVFLNA